MKRGFTLVELLVVVGMLAVIMGAVTTGVGKARNRTMIAKATQDAKEITNAILAYQNYAPNRSLDNEASGGTSWREADENNLAMILGRKSTEGGEQVPVLYNAQLRGGFVLDPWGKPYEFLIKKVTEAEDESEQVYVTAPSLPNFYRLTDEERGKDQ